VAGRPADYDAAMIRAVAFDVGETLVSDTRYWASWADWLEVPRHTVSALVGAVVSAGRDNADALRLLDPDLDVAAAYAAREEAGRGEELDESDLYPDVRPALTALREQGIRVVIAGNQTAKAGTLLRALDLPADAVATSAEWGVAKPDPAFFARVVDLAQAEPHQIVYVGDHPANDVFPAKAAGLRVAHIRRGPWGHLWADDPKTLAAADWSINSLADLTSITAR
jgi:HAD superfamily hydrolase (TIGR01662 family)